MREDFNRDFPGSNNFPAPLCLLAVAEAQLSEDLTINFDKFITYVLYSFCYLHIMCLYLPYKE